MRQAICIENYSYITSDYYKFITHKGEIVEYTVDDTHYVVYYSQGKISLSYEFFKRFYMTVEQFERKEKLKRLTKFNTNNAVY